jgi:hypothetical protein
MINSLPIVYVVVFFVVLSNHEVFFVFVVVSWNMDHHNFNDCLVIYQALFYFSDICIF